MATGAIIASQNDYNQKKQKNNSAEESHPNRVITPPPALISPPSSAPNSFVKVEEPQLKDFLHSTMIPVDVGRLQRAAGAPPMAAAPASNTSNAGAGGAGGVMSPGSAAGAAAYQQQQGQRGYQQQQQGMQQPMYRGNNEVELETLMRPSVPPTGARMAMAPPPGAANQPSYADPLKPAALKQAPSGGSASDSQCEIRYIPVLVQKPQHQLQQQPQQMSQQQQQQPTTMYAGMHPSNMMATAGGMGMGMAGINPAAAAGLPPNHPALMNLARSQQFSMALQQQRMINQQQQQNMAAAAGFAGGFGVPTAANSMMMDTSYRGSSMGDASFRSVASPIQSPPQLYHPQYQQFAAAQQQQQQQPFQMLPMPPSLSAAAAASAAQTAVIARDVDASDVIFNFDGNRDDAVLSRRPGNHMFNSVVKEHRYAFWQAPSSEKLIVAKKVMDEMLEDNPSCRFWNPNDAEGTYTAATFEDTLRGICKALDDGKSRALKAMKKGRRRQVAMDGQVQPSNAPRTAAQTGDRIKEPHDNDVLLGRGKFASEHPGNILFRQIVWELKEEYYVARKNEKTKMVHRIIDKIKSLDPPGRFLEKDEDLTFVDAPMDRVVLKVSQALRERRWFETEKDASVRQEKKRRRMS